MLSVVGDQEGYQKLFCSANGGNHSPPFGGGARGRGQLLVVFFYKQLDIPSVVAMAVSTEIITLMIVFHFSCFIRLFTLKFEV